jgi:hypothetical protein
LWFPIWICRIETITTLCFEGIWQIFKDKLQIAIYIGHCSLLGAKFERCVPSDMKIKWTTISPTLSINLKSFNTLILSSISPYLCLPLPVHSVHFSLEVFHWRFGVTATLRGVNEMIGMGCLLHQPWHTVDDVSTLVL